MSSCAQLWLRDTRVPLATPSDVCVEQALHAGGCKTWLQVSAALVSAWAVSVRRYDDGAKKLQGGQ